MTATLAGLLAISPVVLDTISWIKCLIWVTCSLEKVWFSYLWGRVIGLLCVVLDPNQWQYNTLLPLVNHDWAPNMCSSRLSLNITFSSPTTCGHAFVFHPPFPTCGPHRGASASVLPPPLMRLCLFRQTIKMILLLNRLVVVY